MSKSTSLTSRQRLLLSASALAMLFVMAALGCAALSVDEGSRALLTLTAGGLAALCISVLLQDILDPTLRKTWSWLSSRAARVPKEQAI
jgi:hypothetical protein